jgi:hypothetical protein
VDVPATITAGAQPDVSITLAAAAVADYKDVEVSLSFVKAASVQGWGDFTNPQVVFATGASPAKFTIAQGSTGTKLPIAVGNVAGTITATIVRINGVTVSIPAATIMVAPEVVIRPATVKITGASSTSATVELDGFSTTRALTNAIFTFQAAAGTQLNGAGTPVTVSLAAATGYFLDNATSRANGGNFHLSVPFTYSGDPAALGSVSATLTAGTQTSTPVSGTK